MYEQPPLLQLQHNFLPLLHVAQPSDRFPNSSVPGAAMDGAAIATARMAAKTRVSFILMLIVYCWYRCITGEEFDDAEKYIYGVRGRLYIVLLRGYTHVI